MDKRFLTIMAVIILAFAGIFLFTDSGDDNQSSAAGNLSNHTKGNPDSSLTLEIYADFQCSHCATFAPVVEQVAEKYKNDVLFQYRYFPLGYTHSYSSSRAAEAAGLQGKFFEMHDLLFERQQQWASSQQDTVDIFDIYAQELGLDLDRFNQDFVSEAVNSTINADKQRGNNLGITGTPAFYLNDSKLENADVQTFEDFSRTLEEAIANSKN